MYPKMMARNWGLFASVLLLAARPILLAADDTVEAKSNAAEPGLINQVQNNLVPQTFFPLSSSTAIVQKNIGGCTIGGDTIYLYECEALKLNLTVPGFPNGFPKECCGSLPYAPPCPIKSNTYNSKIKVLDGNHLTFTCDLYLPAGCPVPATTITRGLTDLRAFGNANCTIIIPVDATHGSGCFIQRNSEFSAVVTPQGRVTFTCGGFLDKDTCNSTSATGCPLVNGVPVCPTF